MDEVMDHTSTSVNYHKIVLSPDEKEPVADWREWTREVMDDLQEKQGRELHWYAVNHDNTDNPHVHVVLAGAGENLETGKTEPVKMYTQDYQLLRESGHEHSEYEWSRQIEGLVKEYDQQDHPERDTVARTPENTPDRDLDRGDFDR